MGRPVVFSNDSMPVADQRLDNEAVTSGSASLPVNDGGGSVSFAQDKQTSGGGTRLKRGE